MSEQTLPPTPPRAPARFHFGWIPDAFFHPRQLFTNLAAQTRNTWLTPLLFLMLPALLLVFVQGNLEKQVEITGVALAPAA